MDNAPKSITFYTVKHINFFKAEIISGMFSHDDGIKLEIDNKSSFIIRELRIKSTLNCELKQQH